MCQALLALEIEELNKVDKNVCPRGDYLLGVGASVKMLLMLTGKNRVGRKKNTVGKARETSTTVCSFKEGIREGSNEKSHTGKDLKEVRE